MWCECRLTPSVTSLCGTFDLDPLISEQQNMRVTVKAVVEPGLCCAYAAIGCQDTASVLYNPTESI